ncbi:hypothetical protein [Arthrobacter sp. ES1]|uniref:hypothetical protein n=1 Tax=Arthrobacter sp. ES1 TaxID=1897056 RepID=UPI001CFFC6B3|nr:hypothetical protein [Arthrobacter sp. ES1]
MNNATTEDSTEVEILPEETAVRTAAFLAEAHTSTFLLGQTVQSLIASQKIQSAIVDLSTETGISIANLLVSNPEIEYRIFDTVPLESTDALKFDLGPVLAHSAGTVPFNAEDLSSIDANIVLMPAAAIDAGPGVDVSDGTIAGAVISQLQQTNTNCLLVLPPESGLRRQEDGSYVRLTLKLEE